jgi:hypothetical protein
LLADLLRSDFNAMGRLQSSMPEISLILYRIFFPEAHPSLRRGHSVSGAPPLSPSIIAGRNEKMGTHEKYKTNYLSVANSAG